MNSQIGWWRPLTYLTLCLYPLAGPQSAAHPRTTTPEHTISRHPTGPATFTAATGTPSPWQCPSCSAF